MTDPSPAAPPPPPPGSSSGSDSAGPRRTGEQMRDLGQLRRTSDDKMIAGVAGGIARHLDIDPVVVRIVLAVLTLIGGAGLVLYVAGWLFMPVDHTEQAVIDVDHRSRTVIGWVAVGLATLSMVGDSFSNWSFPWWPIVGGLILVGIVSSHRRAAATGDRGPLLFWPTMGLVAVGLGILWVTGASVPTPAYPALALAIIGVMLVLAAFWGRGGGLILAGFVALAALGVSAAAQSYPGGAQEWRISPNSSAVVQDRYELTIGELVLDLSQVNDPEGLAGRSIDISAGFASVTVIVPDDLDVEIAAEVDWLGSTQLLGEKAEGFKINATAGTDGLGSGEDLRINIKGGIGEFIVKHS